MYNPVFYNPTGISKDVDKLPSVDAGLFISDRAKDSNGLLISLVAFNGFSKSSIFLLLSVCL